MNVFNGVFIELSFSIFLALHSLTYLTQGIRRHVIKDNWRIELVKHIVIFASIIFAYCYVFSLTRSLCMTSVRREQGVGPWSHLWIIERVVGAIQQRQQCHNWATIAYIAKQSCFEFFHM